MYSALYYTPLFDDVIRLALGALPPGTLCTAAWCSPFCLPILFLYEPSLHCSGRSDMSASCLEEHKSHLPSCVSNSYLLPSIHLLERAWANCPSRISPQSLVEATPTPHSLSVITLDCFNTEQPNSAATTCWRCNGAWQVPWSGPQYWL